MIHHFGNAHSISPFAQVKTDAHVNACMQKKKVLDFPLRHRPGTIKLQPRLHMVIMATYCSHDGGYLAVTHVSSYYLTGQEVKYNKKELRWQKRFKVIILHSSSDISCPER